MKSLIGIFLLIISVLTGVSVEASEIIFKDKNGKVLSKSDLKNFDGTVNWEITSNLKIPDKAIEYHNLGRAYGQKGNNELAIQNFENAIRIAPEWPYPYYDLAYTYLLSNKYKEAYKYYKITDELASRGFFTTKTAVHYLGKEQRGELPEGIYLYYLSYEWTNDPLKKLEIVENIINKFPSFAPAWQKRAGFEEDPSKVLAIIEKGLGVDPDLETKGFLLMNKAITLANTGNKAEAIEILGKLALDPKSPLDIEVLSKKTLVMVLEN